MRKILEIGGGRTPYFIRYNIPLSTEDSYQAIDLDEENIELAKSSIKKYQEKGNTCPADLSFTFGDASEMYLPLNNFDEIVISNTISAPIHKSWDRDGNVLKITKEGKTIERPIKEKENIEDPFYIERKKMISEAINSLKSGGMLSVYTDLIIYGIHSYERILEELKNDQTLMYQNDKTEALRIDEINLKKLASGEFCCCFRAEVLPKSEVHRFVKI
jgi:ubiquinone/menaquinone biosynthesis C-methylase UbiE